MHAVIYHNILVKLIILLVRKLSLWLFFYFYYDYIVDKSIIIYKTTGIYTTHIKDSLVYKTNTGHYHYITNYCISVITKQSLWKLYYAVQLENIPCLQKTILALQSHMQPRHSPGGATFRNTRPAELPDDHIGLREYTDHISIFLLNIWICLANIWICLANIWRCVVKFSTYYRTYNRCTCCLGVFFMW